uniref:C-type lectin domain-containing protein n=1 Tax=Sphaeramia orbicularis TaxID=375764 RepID=A0A672Y5T9_9TELE
QGRMLTTMHSLKLENHLSSYNGGITYEYVAIHKTWKDAQTYCRQHHRDLATIENSEENSKVTQIIPFIGIAWIGLYRNPYSWSDKSQSSVRNWLPGRPDNIFGIELTFLCIEKYKIYTNPAKDR